MTEAQAGVHALRGSHTHQLRDGRTQPPLLVLSTLRLLSEQDGGLHPCPGVLGCTRAWVPWPRPMVVKVFTGVGFSMKATLWG